MTMSYDDMEPEIEYGLDDWLEEQLEETWMEFLDDDSNEEMHQGEEYPDDDDE